MEYRVLPKTGESIGVIGFGSAVIGEKPQDEMHEVLKYFGATKEERDYSVLGSFTIFDTKNRCVYCKHCHPCPFGLDIALINKYYDLWLLGDNLAREHYLTLEKKASDRIACGHCDSRCPFSVKQSARMQEILKEFGA